MRRVLWLFVLLCSLLCVPAVAQSIVYSSLQPLVVGNAFTVDPKSSGTSDTTLTLVGYSAGVAKVSTIKSFSNGTLYMVSPINIALQPAGTVSLLVSATAVSPGASTSGLVDLGVASTNVWRHAYLLTVGSSTSSTIAAGAAAGTSPTISCAASHICSGMSGTVSLTTGTSTTTGALLTVTVGTARINLADCWFRLYSSTGDLSSYFIAPSYTTSVATANLGTALTASTAYTVTYGCLGN